MRIPLSWLAEYVDLDPAITAKQVAAQLVRMGLEEESQVEASVSGPLKVGKVLSFDEEPQSNGKTIRWCQVDVGNGPDNPQGIVCGAGNFEVGDLVVAALPGCVLPGGFTIGARKTYGHLSEGMLCSDAELGLSEDSAGIIRLQEWDLDAKPGDNAAQLLGLAGLEAAMVEVNVTPDRGYCFSIRGIAREYAHAIRQPVATVLKDPAKIPTPEHNSAAMPVVLDDQEPIRGQLGCHRFVTRVVRGVHGSAAAPVWMRRRLEQAGVRSISLVVDVTNYVMLALGQPLHAYDLSTVQHGLTVRRARTGETLRTLDDVERTLDPGDLVIADGSEGERVVGLAGVMGGAATEVTDSTTDVLIEAAWFEPVSVARTARRHKLHSEASKRFEREVDPTIQEAAAEWVVRLLVEHGGGVAGEEVAVVGWSAQPRVITMPVTEPTRLTGLTFEPGRVEELLREIGCEITGETDLTVTPPPWRPDLVDGAGLTEEVARLEGYERIPSVLPLLPASRGLNFEQRARRLVGVELVSQGLTEVMTLPFVSAQRLEQFRYPEQLIASRTRLANPLKDDQPLLRPSLLVTLVDAVTRNLSRGCSDVAVFEMGRITGDVKPGAVAPTPASDVKPSLAERQALMEALPSEAVFIAGVLAGHWELPGWWGPGRLADHTDAQRLAARVGACLGVEIRFEAGEAPGFHPGRCARLLLSDGTDVGFAGELHPGVLSDLDLPARLVAFEVNVDKIIGDAGAWVGAGAIGTFPIAKEDVALVVDAHVPAGEVAKALRSGGGDLLESVRLFDVYTGEQVPEGKKSLAFALRMRAQDHTMTAMQVASTKHAAVSAAQKACGAEQRV